MAHIGDIVIYRNRDGHDYPALVTALTDDTAQAVQLEQFPPPGVAKDVISHQWGAPHRQHAPRDPYTGQARSFWREPGEPDA